MLYVLTNNSAVFQAFINEIFRDLLNHYVIVYIDDILIDSATLGEHIHYGHTVHYHL